MYQLLDLEEAVQLCKQEYDEYYGQGIAKQILGDLMREFMGMRWSEYENK